MNEHFQMLNHHFRKKLNEHIDHTGNLYYNLIDQMVDERRRTMKREEQARLMKDKIMDSAVMEFSCHGYEAASMNHICQIGNVSKGIIYHYFQDKDELYLACVAACYHTLAAYYKDIETIVKRDGSLAIYMKIRMQFFKDHEAYRNLFFQALLQTPPHLQQRIEELRMPLSDINHTFFSSFLKSVKLRGTITTQQALLYLELFQNTFNEYFRQAAAHTEDFQAVIEKHEKMIPQWIDFVLHGIAVEEETL